jgi:Spy/CpxP family protein refolding chaperone
MAIFSLLAKLGFDGTAFETGAKRATSLAKGIGREINSTLAGVFTVDKLAQFGMEAIDAAGKINDLSTQLGVTAEFLQEMKFAAEMSGGSLEGVSGALEKIAVARTKALQGNQGLIAAFERFGVTAEELKTAKLEDIFLKIGRAFEGVANPQQLLEPFRELAGRGAGALIPAMVEGLGEAAQQARNLGMVMSNEVITTLDEANDRVDMMKKTMTAGMGSLIANILSPIAKAFEAFGAGLQGVINESIQQGFRLANPITVMKNQIDTFAQSYRSSIEEQDAEMQARREAREKRAELMRKATFDSRAAEKIVSGVAVSAASSDALARTGGFTAFQSNMDRYFGAVRTQAMDIRDIARNTQRTAEAVEE